MKQSHKLLAVVLSVIMILSVLSVIPFTAFAETEGIFTYSVYYGEATITGISDRNITGGITIPSTIGGYPVNSIDAYAFYYFSGLTSITIPDSVTRIGSGAFWGCSGLASITIPDSVTEIGNLAFFDTGYYHNESNWEDGVLYIGNHLIKAKEYVSGKYNIKPGTKIIADSAFVGHTGLTSVIIPDSVTSIGDSAFCDCKEFTSINIPDSVISIGNSAFENCTGLTSVTIGNSVTRIGERAFFGCSKLTSIIIGNSVTSIGSRAFSGCDSLTSITIPDSVTEIGGSAFSGCDSLTSITIPDSVTKIGYFAFFDTGYYHNESNWEDGVLYIGNYLIKAKEYVSGEYNIKPGTKIIADSAFFGCTGLTSIIIPDSVTLIGDNAVFGRTGLTSVTIGNSVTRIGDRALEDCTGLTSITIPDSVTTIGGYAFCGCSNLNSIVIGNSVTDIGLSAFENCTGLKRVDITNIAAWCKINRGGTSNPLYYAHDLYINGELATKITIPDSVTYIGSFAFNGCTGLTSITIPNSVTEIGYGAFYGCTGLTSVIIGDSVTRIGADAFSGCFNITDVYYTGTEQQKNSIIIDNRWLGNVSLFSVLTTWHYNCNPDILTCEHTKTEIKNAKNATCVKGYTGDTVCANCGQLIEKGEVIPALGHNGKWKTKIKATLTKEGDKFEICLWCGKILRKQKIEALGVTYSVDTAKENIEENISVAQSAGSNLPETAEVKAQKSEITEDSITYEIHIENEGEVIQPEAPVLVKLPIPAGFDVEKLNIYHRETDGTKTRMDYIIDGDYAYFETDHFSIYEIIEKLCGDVSGDGSLNNGDLVTLFQYLSGWGNEVNRKAVDINGDGKENNQDLVLLFQFLSGWDVEIF